MSDEHSPVIDSLDTIDLTVLEDSAVNIHHELGLHRDYPETCLC